MTDKGHEVPRDTRGEVREIDDDGDALIQFEGLDIPHYVFQSDFDKLVLSKEAALNLERDMEKLKGEIKGETSTIAGSRLAIARSIHSRHSRSMAGRSPALCSEGSRVGSATSAPYLP